MNPELWELANGVLAILGLCIVLMVGVYLFRNRRRAYYEPVRFISVAFAMIILGHTLKDGAAFLARRYDATIHDWVLISAVVLVGVGKLSCVRVWSEPSWGHWPWVLALVLVAAFVAATMLLG